MLTVRLAQDRIKSLRGDQWWWPCTLHLQVLKNPSPPSSDLSHNNLVGLSMCGRVETRQLFMAECCVGFCWDATMCPEEPVNCRAHRTQRNVGDSGMERTRRRNRSTSTAVIRRNLCFLMLPYTHP